MELEKRHLAPVRGPSIFHNIYSDTRLAWLWLPLRLYAGYVWIAASLPKIGNPRWVQTGEALKDFWQNAVQTQPKPMIEVGWYRELIQTLLNAQAYTWFAKVVAYGELAIGLLLVLGALTGVAALAGAFLNWNYVMAGSASLNGLLLLIELLLILSWKTAGWIGLDRWFLTYLGTPWSPGRLFQRRRNPTPISPSPHVEERRVRL